MRLFADATRAKAREKKTKNREKRNTDSGHLFRSHCLVRSIPSSSSSSTNQHAQFSSVALSEHTMYRRERARAQPMMNKTQSEREKKKKNEVYNVYTRERERTEELFLSFFFLTVVLNYDK